MRPQRLQPASTAPSVGSSYTLHFLLRQLLHARNSEPLKPYLFNTPLRSHLFPTPVCVGAGPSLSEASRVNDGIITFLMA